MIRKNMTPESVGLPRHPFLYTLEQISAVTEIDINSLKINYIFFAGRSTGVPTRHALRAHDVSPPESKRAAWRVEEKELIRWMKVKGFKGYE